MTREIRLLADMIDEVYQRRAWHGTTLKGSLRGMTPEEASWRPAPGRHNIWEIVVHAAYWKYATRRRLEGSKKGGFPLKGSNWFDRPGDGGASWPDDVALLQSSHEQLVKALMGLSPAALYRKVPGSSVTTVRMLYGIAAHDVYHAGQIQLLKRLQR